MVRQSTNNNLIMTSMIQFNNNQNRIEEAGYVLEDPRYYTSMN
jgi:hypothetical protein